MKLTMTNLTLSGSVKVNRPSVPEIVPCGL